MLNVAEYKINELENTLRTQLSHDRTAIIAWQNVTRNRKKDGSDFVNLQKNISGAIVEHGISTIWIKVNCCNNAHYFSDYLSGDFSDLSVDEIFKAIDEHIEKLETQISDNGYNVNHCRELLMPCLEKIQNAIDDLYDSSRGEDLAYNACQLIADSYRYYRKR